MNENSQAVSFSLVLPLVTRDRFAELTGLPVGVVQGFCNKGYLSTVKLGKYSLINLEALRKHCEEKAPA